MLELVVLVLHQMLFHQDLVVEVNYIIDPYPDGLSNEGTVIVKGDLQVDGTTTTVDSFTVNLNDPIINLGITTSTRTVMMTANLLVLVQSNLIQLLVLIQVTVSLEQI